MDRVRARRIASPLLALAASLLLLVGDLSLYGDHALFAAGPFANRATSALRYEEVRGLLGRQVSDQLIKAEPDLIGAKPLIEAAVQGIAAAPPFQGLLAAGLRDLHRTAFGKDDDTATLKLADVGVLVSDALRAFDPRLAAKVPEGLDARIASVSEGRAFTDLAQVADRVGLFAALSLALAVVLFALSIWIARERRLAVRRVGLAAAAVGALVVVGFEVARALVARRFDDPADRGAAKAIFDALLLDLRTWNLVLAAAGLITAAAAASLIRPLDTAATVRRAWAVVSTPPARPWARGGALSRWWPPAR